LLEERNESQADSILVEATNGRAAIGYAGLAHIKGEPTAEWLTRQITASDDPYSAFKFGGLQPMHLGELRRRLVEGLESEFVAAQPRGYRVPIEVLISGWGYPRRITHSKRPSSFTYALTHSGVRGARAAIHPTRRLRFRDPSHTWHIAAIGRSELLDVPGVDRRLRALPKPHFNADDLELVMVEEFRRISSLHGSLVGPDIMAVCLPAAPPQSDSHVRCYRDDSIADVRTGYTPVIIGAGAVLPSAAMNRSQGWSVVYNADTPNEWSYTSETIPPWERDGIGRVSVADGKRF